MELRPLSFKLTPEQITWLDARRKGALITRSEVLRHLIAAAMDREQRRRQPAQSSR